ncbi:MAG: energy transducer TonB, partial [Deferribacteraceae bacterium]|nr:energy transducer TonB [Deferribacteraceae bacterium]
MKTVAIFLIISALLHATLLLIELAPQSPPKKKSTPIEVVTREPAKEIEEPTTPTPEPIKEEPIAPTPIPTPPEIDDVGVGSAHPKPDIDDNELKIKPKVYRPDAPPAPLTLEELLREQTEIAKHGPDRSPEEIIKDHLNEFSELPPDEDKVSFNSFNTKYESYFYKFARNIYGIWEYPLESAMRGEAGIVRVSFSITKEGRLTNINMVESSGYPALDREVMRTLKNMPATPLPDSFGLNMLHINGYF